MKCSMALSLSVRMNMSVVQGALVLAALTTCYSRDMRSGTSVYETMAIYESPNSRLNN